MSFPQSCLVSRFSDEKFRRTFVPTIGVDFKIQTITTSSGKKAKLQIWDTAGQDRFKAITASYYRGGDAIVLCYDTTNRETFDHLRTWLKEIANYAREDARIVLVGTKTDKKRRTRPALGARAPKEATAHGDECGSDAAAAEAAKPFASAGRYSRRQPAFPQASDTDEPWLTEKEDAEAFAAELGVPLVRCSALTGEGVDEAFTSMAEELVAERLRRMDIGPKSTPVGAGGFFLTGDRASTAKAGGVSGFFSRMCFS